MGDLIPIIEGPAKIREGKKVNKSCKIVNKFMKNYSFISVEIQICLRD